MPFVVDDLADWLIGLLADSVRRRAVTFLLGSDQERALRQAALKAVELTAEELCPQDKERAAEIANVINQVFSGEAPPSSSNLTFIQALQAGIAAQLAPLSDADLTGVGRSSADILGVTGTVLAECLTSHLLRQIAARAARGGPLEPLANRLDHDVTHLQGERLEKIMCQLAGEVRAALAQPPAALLGSGRVTHTLPPDLAAFTGRQAEFEQLQQMLRRNVTSAGAVHIASVSGMAGVGKTAFAVHVAYRLASQFPDGQLMVRLHAHTPGHEPVDPSDALAQLLQGDGVAAKAIPAGLDERSALWRDRMAHRRVLLLLDDVYDTEQVRPLLPGSSGTLVLITSRNRLTALTEALPLPIDVLDDENAARLLINLAARADLVPTNDAVARIVALCGYLPLAISMVGGQMMHHTAWIADQVAAELASSDRLSFLSAENLSVSAAFSMSYQNLSPDLQHLFRSIGLLPGTDIDAYGAAALSGTSVAIARGRLNTLFDYHLIDEQAHGRFRFHDLIREYANTIAMSEPAAEREAAIGRLLTHYHVTARAADRYLARRTPASTYEAAGTRDAEIPILRNRIEAVTWMDAERHNLQAAVECAEAQHSFSYAIAIPAAMQGFLHDRGYWEQALALHRTALNAARSAADEAAEANTLVDLADMQCMTDNFPAAESALSSALEICRTYDNRQGEANALAGLGFMHGLMGDFSAAGGELAQAADLQCDIDDRLGRANSLNRLGNVQYVSGDYPAATAALSEALELYRSLDNPAGEANTLNRLGVAQFLAGDYRGAIASQSLALTLHHDLGDNVGRANVLNDLGIVQQAAGQYSESVANLTRALALYRDIGDRFGEATALIELGSAQRFMGNYQDAVDNLSQAVTLCRACGEQLGEATALNELGSAQCATGEYSASLANHYNALEMYRGLQSPHGEADALNYLGFTQSQTGEYAQARENLTEALRLFTEIGNQTGRVQALNNIGELSISADSGRALDEFQQALQIATNIGSPLERARALEGIGRCQLRSDSPEEAIAPLRQALDIYLQIGSPNTQRVEIILDRELGHQ